MKINITGVMYYYYYICRRKLWYFSHNIQMEFTNEDVLLGKYIDETTYGREKKHIMIDDCINIDFMDGYEVIHEVKKARTIEDASIWQTKYYIWYLKQKGIAPITGMIDYPKVKQRVKVVLTIEDEVMIENVLKEIEAIIDSDIVPKRIDSHICKKCAYYELCYI